MKKHSALNIRKFRVKTVLAIFGVSLIPGMAVPAKADSITVNASDNIYAAGQASADSVGGGDTPADIALPSGATYLQFDPYGVTGSYTFLNSGCNSATLGCSR